MKVRAAVQSGDRELSPQDLDVPSELPQGHALLRVEGNGLCGSDYEQYTGGLRKNWPWLRYPLIPGHEVVGRVEAIDPDTQRLWGVGAGDRIAVDVFVTCGCCLACLEGRRGQCRSRFVYSAAPLADTPGLWGGMAEYMFLKPQSVVHQVPDDISVEDAVLFNPLGNAFEWVARTAGVTVGDAVLILGSGQRGLAAVIAAREAGASQIIVTGLARDESRLEFAIQLGATATINTEVVDVVPRVLELTGGLGADKVLDVVPGATEPILDGIDAVRSGGTVVLAGTKGGKAMSGFVSDKVWNKALTIRGAQGLSAWASRRAIDVISSKRYPLDRFHTHTVGLDEAEWAIRVLGRELGDGDPLHITVVPR